MGEAKAFKQKPNFMEVERGCKDAYNNLMDARLMSEEGFLAHPIEESPSLKWVLLRFQNAYHLVRFQGNGTAV